MHAGPSVSEMLVQPCLKRRWGHSLLSQSASSRGLSTPSLPCAHIVFLCLSLDKQWPRMPPVQPSVYFCPCLPTVHSAHPSDLLVSRCSADSAPREEQTWSRPPCTTSRCLQTFSSLASPPPSPQASVTSLTLPTSRRAFLLALRQQSAESSHRMTDFPGRDGAQTPK